MEAEKMIALVRAELAESFELKEALAQDMAPQISEAAALLIDCLQSGSKVLAFGNGGSAADAQHIAAELVVRFEKDRRPLPAMALTTDSSILTAAANDYGYEGVFSRQVDALADSGDVAIAISTSGKSPNVLAAVRSARERGCAVLALTGAERAELAELADVALVVPSRRTARIQEMHVTIIHVLCYLVEMEIAGS